MLRIVEWRDWFRILDDETNAIVAVCETRDEAEAFIGDIDNTPRVNVETVWVAGKGWVTVIVPEGGHPAPSL